MGVSLRAYARHRGVSDAAVRKAIKAGRITPLEDGTLDIKTADQEWALNTDQAQQRVRSSGSKAVPASALSAVDATLKEQGASSSSGTTYLQARTANEVLKAQTSRLKLQQLKGEVVDRAQAVAHVFRLARSERDAWLSWPARISSQMAAELGVDAHRMHVTLESYVRQQLSELQDIHPKVD